MIGLTAEWVSKVTGIRKQDRGLQVEATCHGAKGVGQATTQAMVLSALGIFMLDYFVGVILH